MDAGFVTLKTKETYNDKYITHVGSGSTAQPKLFVINRISADFFFSLRNT